MRCFDILYGEISTIKLSGAFMSYKITDDLNDVVLCSVERIFRVLRRPDGLYVLPAYFSAAAAAAAAASFFSRIN